MARLRPLPQPQWLGISSSGVSSSAERDGGDDTQSGVSNARKDITCSLSHEPPVIELEPEDAPSDVLCSFTLRIPPLHPRQDSRGPEEIEVLFCGPEGHCCTALAESEIRLWWWPRYVRP